MHEPCVPTEGLLKCTDKKVCWFVSVFFGEGCLKVRLSYEEGAVGLLLGWGCDIMAEVLVWHYI